MRKEGQRDRLQLPYLSAPNTRSTCLHKLSLSLYPLLTSSGHERESLKGRPPEALYFRTLFYLFELFGPYITSRLSTVSVFPKLVFIILTHITILSGMDEHHVLLYLKVAIKEKILDKYLKLKKIKHVFIYHVL